MYLGTQEGISKAGNNWKKGEWVLETPGTFPKKVKFTVFGENRLNELGPKLELNKDVVLSVDLESREFNGRWYTDVNAYQVREGAPGFGQPGQYDGGFGGQQPYGGAPQAGAPFGGSAPQAAPGYGAPDGYPAPPVAPQDPFSPGAAPGVPAADNSDDLPF